ncbi:MAG TPA: chemotaxis response regulator protein-glutamate methylesterase [Spirochaetia bacterium]|nr:chemotaxis response regulator protein-glutamate methylesterase [Spirochaetia bacterium]
MDSISVLIVDDSPLMRKLIRSFFEKTNDIEVVGTAMNGKFALHKMESLRPDVIILDLEMPEMDGISFLKEKKMKGNEIPVIILSSMARRGARVTMEAIAAGASDFFLKPSAEDDGELGKVAGQIIQLVRIYGNLNKKRRPERIPEEPPIRFRAEPLREEAPAKKITPKRATERIEVIAIGISTGGPNALRRILPNLRSDLDIPILVVQHMPRGFTEEFALSLDRICPLPVKQADNGDIIRGGRVLIAPGDLHLSIEDRRLARTVRLDDSPPVNGHKPSVEILFSTVAKLYQNHACALIMTGMGKDGAAAIGSIYEEGGMTIAQDSASSVVFGMPKVAIERGFIQRIAALDEIPDLINSLKDSAPPAVSSQA